MAGDGREDEGRGRGKEGRGGEGRGRKEREDMGEEGKDYGQGEAAS
jgi:hypothetical protein